MSLWLEVKFLKQISHRLEGFVSKKEGQSYLYNCRAPCCGDSEKKHNKKRGYFYDHSGKLFYRCHNCGVSQSFDFFLKNFDPALHKIYKLELFKESSGRDWVEPTESTFDKISEKFKNKPKEQSKENSFFDGLTSILNLPSGHEARSYVAKRKIPKKFIDYFWFAENFFSWSKTNTDKFENAKDDHPRIVIPWYSRSGEIFAYQARSLHGEEPKYYTIVLDPEKPKIFGLNMVDESKPIKVVEGPIDSMFLDNAVAVGSSSLLNFEHKNSLYIPDRDVRNREIMKYASRIIDTGAPVCLLPLDVEGKDINEMVLMNKFSPEDVEKMIADNTFSGRMARLKFGKWCKIDF